MPYNNDCYYKYIIFLYFCICHLLCWLNMKVSLLPAHIADKFRWFQILFTLLEGLFFFSFIVDFPSILHVLSCTRFSFFRSSHLLSVPSFILKSFLKVPPVSDVYCLVHFLLVQTWKVTPQSLISISSSNRWSAG